MSLYVPEQAIIELDAFTNGCVPKRQKEAAVRAIATPVTVAELRYWADALRTTAPMSYALGVMTESLNELAATL